MPAPQSLRSSINSLWALRGRPRGLYSGLPKPYVELVVSLSGTHQWRAEAHAPPLVHRDGWLTPVQFGPRFAETAGELHLVGARLGLLAAARLFGAPAVAAGGVPVPLDAVLGSEAAPLRERLREARGDRERLELLARWLGARLGEGGPAWLPPPGELRRTGWRTDALADLLQLSPRGLRKRFADRLGIGPKLWLQLGRFDALLRAGPTPGSLADAAVAFGFADQAHMTAEFARFAGLPPGRYVRARASAAAPDAAPHFVPGGQCRILQDGTGISG